ncbi:MAG: GNAT family N-acetyltransferase [Alphaproteobacteria bacterium]
MTTPVIETERLRLRAWHESDFSGYCAHRSCDKRQAFVGGAVSAERAWDEFCAMIGFWSLRGYGTFAVAARRSGEALGYAGLWHPPDIDEPELCWSLFPGAEGRGYATEAAAAARDWAYEALGLPPLMSFIHPDNAPSQAVAARLGAVFERRTTLRGAPRLVFRHVGPEAASRP